jgi:hypothetical protein
MESFITLFSQGKGYPEKKKKLVLEPGFPRRKTG